MTRPDLIDAALMAMAACNFWAAVMLGHRIDRWFASLAPCEAAVVEARRQAVNDHLFLVVLVAIFYVMYLAVGGSWMYLGINHYIPEAFYWTLGIMLASCHMVMARVLMCARTVFARVSRVRIGDPAEFVERYCTMDGEAFCCVVARHLNRRKTEVEGGDS